MAGILIYSSCLLSKNNDTIKLIEIELNKNIAFPKAEFSGLDWYKDNLILLPQYPDRFRTKYNGCLFSISKSDITSFLKTGSTLPVPNQIIELNSNNIEGTIDGFQGYEAIAFNGLDVYVSIEAENNNQMKAFIIKGNYDIKHATINLDVQSIKEIPMPVNIKNMAIESLVIYNEKIFTIYEANGKNINSHPNLVAFDLDLNNYEIYNFPNIEYRITDATRSLNNKFWVINYLYQGDTELLKPINKNLKSESDINDKITDIEQLLQLQVEENGTITSYDNSIRININSEKKSRNWEGIVQYDSLGFLLITDKFPSTILAYLPYSMGILDLKIFEENKKYGYRNALGVDIIEPKFEFAQQFNQQGIAAVIINNTWFYINKQGEKIIKPYVVDNGPDYFSEGLARYESENKFGFFDQSGTIVILAKFDYARSFSEEMAAICIGCKFLKNKEHSEVTGGKWGFINMKGEIVIPVIYDSVSDFENGVATVNKNGNTDLISKN